jgi:hypothetical protein
MSVTFSPELSAVDTAQFELICDNGEQIGDIWTGTANAHREADAHALVCTYLLCQQYGAEVRELHADGDPVPVNVHNRNAQDLLAALGYLREPLEDGVGVLGGPVYDMSGDDNARAFLDRVELALGVNRPVDAGLPEITYRAGTADRPGTTVVDFGRAPGHLTMRLEELRELASRCLAKNLRVTWG